MLRPPHTRYHRIYVYHVNMPDLPAIDDPDLIGAWPEGPTTVLFFHKPKDLLLSEICRRHACAIVYQADLDYKDWETGQEISAFTVGPLTVAPVWEPGPTTAIRLDPGVIFGTGFHPTTRLCLESLVALHAAPGSPVNSALDLGCGTGLLAIAAARLGVKNVLAVDENPLACKVAAANVERNAAGAAVRVEQLDLSQTLPPINGVDLVMANLFHDLLASLFARPAFWQARRYIISGFFSAREEALLACLPTNGLRIRERRQVEKWGLWIIERQP